MLSRCVASNILCIDDIVVSRLITLVSFFHTLKKPDSKLVTVHPHRVTSNILCIDDIVASRLIMFVRSSHTSKKPNSKLEGAMRAKSGKVVKGK